MSVIAATESKANRVGCKTESKERVPGSVVLFAG